MSEALTVAVVIGAMLLVLWLVIKALGSRKP
jgi:hypothetical protein